MNRNRNSDLAHELEFGRREFLAAGAGAAALGMLGWPQSADAQPRDGWIQGQLAHLIPTASHERFLIKASFNSPLNDTPRLSINGKPVAGMRTDNQGRFWRFDVSALIGMDEALKPTEKNGFTVIDVTPDKMVFTLYLWRPPQPIAEIDTMKPALSYEVLRK
jgi:hypothetical protein